MRKMERRMDAMESRMGRFEEGLERLEESILYLIDKVRASNVPVPAPIPESSDSPSTYASAVP